MRCSIDFLQRILVYVHIFQKSAATRGGSLRSSSYTERR